MAAMTGKIRRIDYYPDEYISGVGGVLRADEQGVYWMVCTLIMSEGGPVPFDDRRVAGLCRLRPADIKRIVGALVERGKLTLNDGKLSQKRAQSELERAANRIQSASANGAKGGRPKKKTEQNQQNTKAGGSSDEKLTTNQQPPTLEVVDANASTVRKARGTRISAEWKARENERQWARNSGWPEDEIEDVETRFRDYWLTRVKDATKTDWDRTFLNRLKDVNDRRKRAPPPRHSNGGDRMMNVIRDAYNEPDEQGETFSPGGVVRGLPAPGARGH